MMITDFAFVPETWDDRVEYLAIDFLWARERGFIELSDDVAVGYELQIGVEEQIARWRNGDPVAAEFVRLAWLVIALDGGLPISEEERTAGRTADGYTLSEIRRRLRAHVCSRVAREEDRLWGFITDLEARLAHGGHPSHLDRLDPWWEINPTG